MKEPNIEFPDHYLEKPLPSSLGSENVILGAILLDNSLISDALENLVPDDFYSALNKRIFTAMHNLFEKGKSIDPILIGEELKKDGLPDTPISSITNLTLGIPHLSGLTEYIEIVKGKSRIRSLIRAATNLTTCALSENADADQVLELAETSIYSISNQGLSSGFVNAIEGVNDSAALAAQRAQQGDVVTGLHSGFVDLDTKLQGFQDGELIILAARPSIGKSALAFNIGQNVSFEYDKTVAAFSMEMSLQQLSDRIICSETGINSQRYRSGNLTEDEWSSVNQARAVIGNSKLFIDDSGYMTLPIMRSKLRRLARTGPIHLVVVDYIQLVDGGKNKNGREQQVSEISRGLKLLAREFNCPVLALSQLNREAEKRSNHRPTLSDLRESGAIEQDADMVLFIYREDIYIQNPMEHSNIAEIIIAKNRNGPLGTVSLRFDGNTVSFHDLIEGY